MELSSEVQFLKGVGPKKALQLGQLSIACVEDLLYFFPRDYEDRRKIVSIVDLNLEEPAVVRVQILSIQEKYVRKNMLLLNLLVSDATAQLKVSFFNARYLKKKLSIGQEVYLYGVLSDPFSMSHPEIEIINEESQKNSSMCRIVPIYSLVSGINMSFMRRLILSVLSSFLKIVENLPQKIIETHSLMGRGEALRVMHSPSNWTEVKRARFRFVYEEFFFYQSLFMTYKQIRIQEKCEKLCIDLPVCRTQFLNALPFDLTEGQKKACDDIEADLLRGIPMSRLLQGDVGSGKTVVSLYALFLSVRSGYQGALMVPTEILADQQKNVFRKILSDMGIKVALLCGSLTTRNRRLILEDIALGRIDIVIGTHALFQEKVVFKKLKMVVIDEQHKFGVSQRLKVKQKGDSVDMLIMTATPIPRTLAITLYGDLNVSVIKDKPKGRQTIKSYWINESKRQGLVQFVLDHLKQGRQVYWVCPFVEVSEKDSKVCAVEKQIEWLKSCYEPDFKVQELHGRMEAWEKDSVMDDFREGRIHILVASTVIEVGVDVPNANVIVIEDAQRFGLSQLHQLRGRVGRGKYQSYCIVISSSQTPTTVERLEAFVSIDDGFKLSEEDMRLRGPGELLGDRQHGLPQFELADIVDDSEILCAVRQDVLLMFDEDFDALKESLGQMRIKYRKNSCFVEAG